MMITHLPSILPFFFFNDTATTEIYTLSLHDALPILCRYRRAPYPARARRGAAQAAHRLVTRYASGAKRRGRSEEHTSELQSRQYLVCRLLLEKKKKVSSRPITNSRRETRHTATPYG